MCGTQYGWVRKTLRPQAENPSFHDVHIRADSQVTQERHMMEHRVLGANIEVVYADDTICISQDERAMNRLLEAIESEGA